MNRVYLLTGGNLGDRLMHVTRAKEAIVAKTGTLLKASSIYETAPWGIFEQPAFFNQVLLLETSMCANELLKQILLIEEEMGRVRNVKFGPRFIDIDILFFNEDIINNEHLTVPHAEIQNRRFVLAPMNELAPDYNHPILKKTISTLLEDCKDKLEVKVWTDV